MPSLMRSRWQRCSSCARLKKPGYGVVPSSGQPWPESSRNGNPRPTRPKSNWKREFAEKNNLRGKRMQPEHRNSMRSRAMKERKM